MKDLFHLFCRELKRLQNAIVNYKELKKKTNIK